MARHIVEGSVMNFHIVTEANQHQWMALLEENAMAGMMNTVMTRAPDYLSRQHYFGEEHPFLAEENSYIVGCYQLMQHQGFVNGKLTTVGYLNSLRVTQNYRHKIRVLKAGFQHLSQNASLPHYCYTSIASDNLPAQRLLEEGIEGLPRYHSLGELYTLLISKAQGKTHHLWHQVEASQQESWLSFYNGSSRQSQLSPYLTEEWLNQSSLPPLGVYDNGSLQASCILWNQLDFKQVKVTHYHPLLNAFRPLYNGYAHVTKRPQLPKCFDAIPQSFLAFLQYKDNQQLIPLIEDVLPLCQTPLLTFSLSEQHPLLQPVIQRFKPFVYKTRIYRVDFGESPKWQDQPFNLEASIL